MYSVCTMCGTQAVAGGWRFRVQTINICRLVRMVLKTVQSSVQVFLLAAQSADNDWRGLLPMWSLLHLIRWSLLMVMTNGTWRETAWESFVGQICALTWWLCLQLAPAVLWCLWGSGECWGFGVAADVSINMRASTCFLATSFLWPWWWSRLNWRRERRNWSYDFRCR